VPTPALEGELEPPIVGIPFDLTPEILGLGEQAELSWEILGWGAIFSGEEELVILLPPGLAPASDSGFAFSAESGEMRGKLTESEGKVTLTADAGLAFPLQINVNVERSGELLAGNVKTFGAGPTALAAMDGESFVVAESTTLLRNVAAAWDSSNRRYLFVWSEPRVPDCTYGAWCYDRIYSQLVAADGTLIGSRVVVYEALGWAAAFRLAYSAMSQSFLLIYSNNDVVLSAAWAVIRALDSTGTPIGSSYILNDKRVGDLIYVTTVDEFALSYNTDTCTGGGIARFSPDATVAGWAGPARVYDMAYNAQNDEVLVAFPQCDAGQVRVQRFDLPSWNTIGPSALVPDAVTETNLNFVKVRLAHTTSANEYHINWAEDLNTSGTDGYDQYRIWGRRLQSDGSIVPSTSAFEITVTDPTQPNNRLAADLGGGFFLVGWQWEAQRISVDGSLIGDEIQIAAMPGPISCSPIQLQEHTNCWQGPRLISGGASPTDLLIAWTEESGGLYTVRGLTVGPVPLEGIADAAVLSRTAPKSGIADPRADSLSTYACAQGGCGDPINTVTGGFDYSVSDISIPTSAGPLVFQRSYSSLATAKYTQLLGFGWAHNHDTRLIFPGDPGGQPGNVLFKAHSANQYEFTDNGDGTYTPAPGLLASLNRDDGPPITYTIIDPRQATYIFNEFGRLLTWADPQGHSWTYSYDGSNRLDRVTDETGQRYLDLDYDPQGRIERVADQTGRDVTFGYDPAGDLTTVTDVADLVWSYFYDSSHRLRQALDPDYQQIVRTEYDPEGHAYQQFDGSDTLVLQVTYNPDGTTVFTDALGNETTHSYDERNTLTGTANEAGDDTARTYDNNFRPDSLVDENLNTTTLTWSADGANLTQLVDAEDNQIDLDYNSLNSLTEITDGRRYITTYTYDENNPDPAFRTLLLSVEDPLDKLTGYTYTTSADAPQPPGLLKTITDPNNNLTRFVYDEFGQRVEVIDPLDHSTLYGYDELGRLETVEDPLGHVAWTCFDSAGRVVRSVANASGDGGTPQTDPCDAANYQPSSDPALDRITTSVYEDSGNLIATVDPAGAISRIYYDINNRPHYFVQNLTGQTIENPNPPAYSPSTPDQNVRTETVYDDNGSPIATIDNAGIITRTYYDGLNRPQYVVVNLVGQGIEVGTPPAYSATYPDRNLRTEMRYDDGSNTISTIDTLGMITRTYYDGDNRPVTVVQNLTGQTIDDPNPPARNPSTPDQNVRTDTYYDENGNAIASQDPNDVITRTYFDPANRPQFVVQNLYGQSISVEMPPAFDPGVPDRNVRIEYVYDDAGNQIATIDPNGVITRTYYDDANRAVTVVRNFVGQPISNSTPPARNPAYPDQNVRTDTVYDDAGQAIASIDPNNIVIRTYYDGLGRVRFAVQNLIGQTIENSSPPDFNPAYPDENVRTESVYDSTGDAIATIDNAGIITRTYSDELHRPVSIVRNLIGQSIYVSTPPTHNPAYPDQNVRTDTSYGSVGEVVESIDELDHETAHCYDGQGREIKRVQNPSVGSACGTYTPVPDSDRDLITSTTYDGIGNRKSIVDPNGFETTYTYDGVYRLTSELDPLLHSTGYGYDSSGNRTSMTDAEGVVTSYEYDALARLSAVVENYRPGINPDHEINVRTEYTYDAAGSRKTILDGRGYTTAFTYDSLGRLNTERDALNHTTTYGYDPAGNRTSLLDAEGFTTTFAHDDLARLVGIDYPAPDVDVSYTYDGAGDRVSMTDGVGETSWLYDDQHRPTSVTDPFSGVVGYGYDAAGNRLSLTHPDTRSVGYVYDDANRLETVTDWDSLLTTYVFDKGGRLGTVSLPNGIVSTYLFDSANRLTSLTHIDGSTTFATYGYTYDDVGNRLTTAETLRQPGASVSVPDAIFANGFESGNLSGWSSSSTGSGTLTITTASAMDGTYGMQALINSTSARYVQDAIPYAESRYRARFYFDPNSSTMANNNAYYLFYGYTGSSTVVLRFEFGFTTAGGYRVRVNVRNNASTWTNSAWVNVTDAPHYFELDWQSGASGRVDWWIDGAPQPAATGFDNSARRIDQVRLGTVAGLDSGTSGTVYFDAFESRRFTSIGSGTALPDAIFADDFESGGFGYWSASTGVSNTTAASLAPAGTRGMSVPLASATTAKYVTDRVPGVEPRYRARFYFDPNSITMANNSDHVIFYGDSGTTPVLQLNLGYTTAGGYRLRTRIRDNSSTWNNSAWVNIGDAPHVIELDWQSGTSGSLAWWIDEAPQPAPNAINNNNRRIDRVRLGAVANVDSTTNGALYFDASESRRQSYIGPMGGGLTTQNITYDYDPLYRLTAADYDTGQFFHYTYDAVGNRLTQTTHLASNSYVYDIANRLTSVDGVTYTWSDNGNLLSDGLSTYSYNHANRLASVTQGVNSYTFAYNGLGDRLRQTVNGVPINYTLDLAAGLTQVLSDGTNAYLYGISRIGEEQPGGWQYHLGDALGSVRQLADPVAIAALARSFEPFGAILTSTGTQQSYFQFSGEARDLTGLLFLRDRYSASDQGRFISRDVWRGSDLQPGTQNGWVYALNNPLVFSDPAGSCPKPTSGGRRVICLALFILPRTISAGGVFTLHGDGRDFSSDSPLDASRGYVWIDLGTREAEPHVNPTAYIFHAGPDIYAYIWHEPSPKNRWSLNNLADGSISLEYDLVVSGYLDWTGAAPHINGSFRFREGEGYIDYSFMRDGFPWAEAYYYDEQGNANVIAQDPAVRGNPFDLFAIEPDIDFLACVARSIQSLLFGSPRQSSGAGRAWQSSR